MLPKPVGRQREVLCLPAQGHFVVLGTAGSGKTTLAILRAVYLAREFTSGEERTLLVTFNNTLLRYLEAMGGQELAGVDVHTYHKFARGYLRSRGKMGPSSVVRRPELLVEEALKEIRREMKDPALNRPVKTFCEEFAWIARSGIRSVEEYIKAERVGRIGTRVPRKQRPVFFAVYKRYLDLRAKAGYQYDWDDIAQHVLEELNNDTSPRRYRHIVIDEGQDFSPVMIRSLAAAIPNHGSLTFFGDVAQQIYGSRLSWRSAGLHLPKVWEFRENYRNTKQIARLALAIAHSPYYEGVPDLVEPTYPRADGPLPALVGFASEKEERKFVVQQAARMGRTQSVAVLTRTVEGKRDYVGRLRAGREAVVQLDRALRRLTLQPGVYVGTYHAAKGMEFDAVIMPHCYDDTFLTPERLEAAGGDELEVLHDEVRLLYVGVTRAKNRLILTYTGEPTRMLPTESGLYQEVRPESDA